MPIRWRAARRAFGALEAMEPRFWFVYFGARLRYGARARAGPPKFPRIICAFEKAKLGLSNDVYVALSSLRSFILRYLMNVEVAEEINFGFGKKSIFSKFLKIFLERNFGLGAHSKESTHRNIGRMKILRASGESLELSGDVTFADKVACG